MIADTLREARTIRERCANITAAVSAGQSRYFVIESDALEETAELVVATTRKRYPAGIIPYHSRWRHFEAGSISRRTELDAKLQEIFGSPSPVETARAQIDLTVVSVLLDAGAGSQWAYHDSKSGQDYQRSEGLGVASFRAFLAGAFSSKPDEPCRVDGSALQSIDKNRLAHVFQAHEDNPLIGLEQRATLLNRLGEVLLRDPARFGPDGRPGEIFFRMTDKGRRTEIPAAELLHSLLVGYSDIWMTGSQIDGQSLGDTWRHPHAGGEGQTAGWVPFHKLSQWLTYSLLEPFENGGVTVHSLDELTGLPEYRNGGLLMDTGVIKLKDPALANMPMTVADEAIIEWRALTVSLIDELATVVREQMNQSADQLPLACLLEGGTWAAGRALASDLRGGNPPLTIVTDGTVF
ncbi:MAG: URC4/urg3 family protein [Burkholderiaceae bacterium]